MFRSRRHSILLGVLFEVFEDEHDLAGTYETEILACQRFNRRGIFVQPPHLFAEHGILPPKLVQRSLQLLILPPGIHRLHQTLLTDEGVDDQHDGDEDEQDVKAALSNERRGGRYPAMPA